VFDYKAKFKWKDTLHLWNYSLEMPPTHGALSPLRHTICNPVKIILPDLPTPYHALLQEIDDVVLDCPMLDILILNK
jgi:hypothetical protein